MQKPWQVRSIVQARLVEHFSPLQNNLFESLPDYGLFYRIQARISKTPLHLRSEISCNFVLNFYNTSFDTRYHSSLQRVFTPFNGASEYLH